MSASVSTACFDLLLALAGRRGYVDGADARSVAEDRRPYRNEWRDRVYVTAAHREAEDAGLVELRVFGRGLNRQSRWDLTEAGRDLAERDP